MATVSAQAETDALAALLDEDLGASGLDELDTDDRRIPAKVWNMKGVDADGNPIPPNVFYDTVSETTAKALDLVLVDLFKTRQWREYHQGEGRSHLRCASWDTKTGTLVESGRERRCQGCPESRWTTDERGKRVRPCSVVYNVLAVDRADGTPCVLRFKRTSLRTIKDHLAKHHLGKRVVKGRRSDYPLFSFQVGASLKMSDDGKYALPVLERGPVLEREEFLARAESARVWRQEILPQYRHEQAEASAPASDESGEGNTSFDPHEFDDEPAAQATHIDSTVAGRI